jgi:hypothetical protein
MGWDNNLAEDAKYVSDLLCFEVKSQLWFVDYPRACKREVEEKEYPGVLELHRDAIAQGVNSFNPV